MGKSNVDVFSEILGTADSQNPSRTDTCFGPDLRRYPCAQQATLPIEYLQKPGELVIFPGHWWHQTYHYSRTVGFAGQVLNDRNLRQVMEHIIQWCQLETPPEAFWSSPARDIITQVIGEAIDAM